MSSLMVLIASIVFLYIGWRWYSRLIEKKVVLPDANTKTPAVACYDGVEYIPARTPLLFGHHFSNIAGAGPIIGPLVAASIFGWLPTLLWIILGVVFIGAVHDYMVLAASMRNKGLSIATLSETFLSKGVRIAFSIFLLLALILVIAVFAVTTAQTLLVEPSVVIPTLSIIPLAIIISILVYRLRVSLVLITILTFIFYAFLIYLGYLYPISLQDGIFGLTAVTFWIIVLFLYGILASLLPVGLLDQPRDYVSSFTMFGGLLLGLSAIIIGNPTVKIPSFITLSDIKEGPIWPILFILVACGAISGFHALVASGTTAKQLRSEVYQRHIGYGGMLLEGLVALMALLVVASGLAWEAEDESCLIKLLKEKGWIYTFGVAYSNVVTSSFVWFDSSKVAGFAMLMLNAFVLTTLDTAVRLGRYILGELVGETIPLCKNRLITTMIIVIPAFFLAITKGWQAIWPVFASANQLIAGLCLITVSSYLAKIKRPKLYTLLPMIFMCITTMAALIYNIHKFLTQTNYLLGSIALILLLLSVYVLVVGVRSFCEKKGC